MFFVGATGQLITLLLTVGLPFVFLLSGSQNTESKIISERADHLLVQAAHNSIEIIDAVTIATDFSPDLEKAFYPDRFQCIKIPIDPADKPVESHCLNQSGNKAPPY